MFEDVETQMDVDEAVERATKRGKSSKLSKTSLTHSSRGKTRRKNPPEARRFAMGVSRESEAQGRSLTPAWKVCQTDCLVDTNHHGMYSEYTQPVCEHKMWGHMSNFT